MIKTIQAAVPVARIELADAVQMDAINKYSKRDPPVAPNHGGTDFCWATKPEDRRNLWRARHDVVYADKALRERGQLSLSDVCGLISRLAECITETQKDLS
jgi:D-lactate dehydrogenase (cytochrome)